LLKVLGLKVGLLKDGEKINSVKSAKSKHVVEESQMVQIKIRKCTPFSSSKPSPKEVTKAKDTMESRTVKFRSHEEPKSQKVHLEKKNLKKKVAVKGGLRERASLNSIKKKVDEERRQRNKIILQSVQRLGFGGSSETNNMNSSMPLKDNGWVSREGRVDENFTKGNDEFVRMPSDMMGNPMNNGDGFVDQQPYEGSRQVVDSNSVRQVVWDDGSQVGDQNMNEVVWGEQRRCLLQREVAIDPMRYETEQVHFRNIEIAYEGGMDFRNSENMGRERQWGSMSIDSEHGRLNSGGNMGMIYQGGDMGSEREGRLDLEQRGGNIGIMNECVNLRGGNMQSESDYEGRQGYGNRREVEELADQSYRREILEDENSEDRKRKRRPKSRRKKSDLDRETSFSRRTRRDGNEFRDKFRERSSSNSQFGDHFEKRVPHRDYSR